MSGYSQWNNKVVGKFPTCWVATLAASFASPGVSRSSAALAKLIGKREFELKFRRRKPLKSYDPVNVARVH